MTRFKSSYLYRVICLEKKLVKKETGQTGLKSPDVYFNAYNLLNCFIQKVIEVI
ncbi:hypothetical protein HanXRQr2_Chr17g0787731 [Helianthus annuus]|uniref:Uncharacterized protein n=1 Tax=Helianthus annuus TaxID=4232 RepID=A0A9K3DF86_HELAN|nr:hypothetical protein HanXRQr2_Chr17g0787731 [Helianthus annuus]KAJ0811887.1 hypothetical protein HanPSC8_Chr17g0755771 [Helianthus annuus]